MKFVLAAALVATSLAVAAPAVVLAADAAPKTPLVCHPATGAETADATVVMDGRSIALSCLPGQMMMMKMKSPDAMKQIGSVAAKTRAYGPNIDGLLTPGQIDAAWKKWTDETFHIPASAP